MSKLPFVEFTPESASPLDCVVWAGQNIVQGELRESVRDDIPGAVMICSRVIHSITLQVKRPKEVLAQGDSTMEDALAVLQTALGVQALGGGVIRQLIARKLAELIASWMEDLLEGEG